jgi:hypothetical protein
MLEDSSIAHRAPPPPSCNGALGPPLVSLSQAAVRRLSGACPSVPLHGRPHTLIVLNTLPAAHLQGIITAVIGLGTLSRAVQTSPGAHESNSYHPLHPLATPCARTVSCSLFNHTIPSALRVAPAPCPPPPHTHTGHNHSSDWAGHRQPCAVQDGAGTPEGLCFLPGTGTECGILNHLLLPPVGEVQVC